jgi:hypothetical protein
MALSFFDMAVSNTPPNGHLETTPLTLGANWSPNDIRVLMLHAEGQDANGLSLPMPVTPDPPTGFAAAYRLAPSADQESIGVFWRRLVTGDTDTSVAWRKPPGWANFNWATLTIRGADPTSVPAAGRFTVTYVPGDAAALTSSVTVPAAGTMVFFLGTSPDRGTGGIFPNSAASMGLSDTWKHLAATDKSGANFDTNTSSPSIIVVGKSYASAGATGQVPIPVAFGSPTFVALYLFVRPAQDVTIPVGAA